MKKKLRNLFSLILAVAMVATTMPANVKAADPVGFKMTGFDANTTAGLMLNVNTNFTNDHSVNAWTNVSSNVTYLAGTSEADATSREWGAVYAIGTQVFFENLWGALENDTYFKITKGTQFTWSSQSFELTADFAMEKVDGSWEIIYPTFGITSIDANDTNASNLMLNVNANFLADHGVSDWTNVTSKVAYQAGTSESNATSREHGVVYALGSRVFFESLLSKLTTETYFKIEKGTHFTWSDTTLELEADFVMEKVGGTWRVKEEAATLPTFELISIDANHDASHLMLNANVDFTTYGIASWTNVASKVSYLAGTSEADAISYEWGAVYAIGSQVFFESLLGALPTATYLKFTKDTQFVWGDVTFVLAEDFEIEKVDGEWRIKEETVIVPSFEMTGINATHTKNSNLMLDTTVDFSAHGMNGLVLVKSDVTYWAGTSEADATSREWGAVYALGTGVFFESLLGALTTETYVKFARGTQFVWENITYVLGEDFVIRKTEGGEWMYDVEGPKIYRDGIIVAENDVIYAKAGQSSSVFERHFHAEDAMVGLVDITFAYSDGALDENGKLVEGIGHTLTMTAEDGYDNMTVRTVTLNVEVTFNPGDSNHDEKLGAIDLISLVKAIEKGSTNTALYDLDSDGVVGAGDAVVLRAVLIGTRTLASFAFHSMDDVVYPYVDAVREYLEAGAEADVNDYEYHVNLQAKPVTVSWQLSNATAEKYKLEISTESDYSNAEVVEISGNKTSYDLKFLLRDTQYYLRLTVPGQDLLCTETTFKTAYLGPRFLDVGGLYQNCRDLGGYKIGDKTLLYNMVIRGSSPDNCATASTNTFTDEGTVFLNETVKIKSQLDLRGSGENCGRTTSSFSDANYVHVPLTAYEQCFSASQAELYAQAFRVFADPANYPVYVHCAGGADRTGTVAAILLAYLGVSKDEVIQDYVVTSFSPVCASQGARSREYILAVLDGLNAYDGDTLSEKAKSYLSSIGMTQRELFNIKAIMFGENLDDFVPTVDHGIQSMNCFYSTASGEDYSFTLNDNIGVSEVLLDNNAVAFEQNEKTITIASTVMMTLSSDVHTITVVFSDGERTTVSISVDFIDLTGDLQVTKIEEDGELTYVYINASSSVFNDINYHFHTRRDTLFPDVEPNIKINGRTIADINDNTDMSGYTWTMSPGAEDSRHRVPVSIYALGSSMKLILRTEWLADYLDGRELSVTICEGMNYSKNGKNYKVLSDITYLYTNEVWVKVI